MKKHLIRILGVYVETLSFLWPAYAAKAGFKLFCRPFRIPISRKQMAFFNTAEKFQFNHQGYTIQGYRWGSGEKKILFLHGWQSHTYRWKSYIEALSGDAYTIYALDAPGHGLSSGNFLTVPLYSGLIENFMGQHNNMHTIVAHSIGGFALLYALHRNPLLPVNRIVLLAPPGEASDFLSVFQETLNLSNRTIKLVVNYFAKQYQVTPDFFSARKFVKGLKVEGLIIHDEADLEAPYAYSITLSKAWPQSRLITTEGYGHNLKSPSVVRDVVNFIGSPVHQTC